MILKSEKNHEKNKILRNFRARTHQSEGAGEKNEKIEIIKSACSLLCFHIFRVSIFEISVIPLLGCQKHCFFQ